MSRAADAALMGLESTAYQWIVTADLDFANLAQDEVLAVDDMVQIDELAPGILLVTSSIDFGRLSETWLVTPPIFVRHVCPVQSMVFLPAPSEDEAPDLAELVDTVTSDLLPALSPNWTFSVQTRVLHGSLKPYQVNQAVADKVASAGLTLDVRLPRQVISIVLAGGPKEMLTAWIGASSSEHNLSDWAGGMRRFAREPGQISRAEFKLLEAIEVFLVDMPPRGVALDLGASPGGWTRVLRQLDQYVTAVDPGDLDARLASDPGVRHKRMTAEAYLAEGPDPFDIIVNDMRMDARDSARLMVRYADKLYPHGWALMTLKLPGTDRRKVLNHSLDILRESYSVAGARQLFHNRSEVTVYLRRLSG